VLTVWNLVNALLSRWSERAAAAAAAGGGIALEAFLLSVKTITSMRLFSSFSFSFPYDLTQQRCVSGEGCIRV